MNFNALCCVHVREPKHRSSGKYRNYFHYEPIYYCLSIVIAITRHFLGSQVVIIMTLAIEIKTAQVYFININLLFDNKYYVKLILDSERREEATGFTIFFFYPINNIFLSEGVL